MGLNNGNTIGDQGAGRRQITWDGADNDSAPARLPKDFFNAVAPRGASIFSAENDDDFDRLQVQQSADSTNPTGTAVEFLNINATYATAFATFSSPRLFASLDSNKLVVKFFIAGTSIPATVEAFGAVFTDVDSAGSTSITYYDSMGQEIFSRNVLASAGNESLSFLGVSFPSARIARVAIVAGEAALGVSDVTQVGANPDLVVMDDFIYGEPTVIAPPAPLIGSPAEGSTETTRIPAISGVAEAGSIVEVFDASASLGTVVAGSASWSIRPNSTFGNGSHTVTATATNSAGTSLASTAVNFSVNDQLNVAGDVDSSLVPGKPSITKVGKQVTMQMDSIPNAVAFLIETLCLKNGERIKTTRVVFDNQAQFNKPVGSNCKYSYSAIGTAGQTRVSPKAK